MKDKTFLFQNFVRGLKRDSTNPDDLVNSLYTMTNYKLKYTSGMPRLVVRKGYERWNTVETPAPVKQLYLFTDQTRNDVLMGVCGGYWYRFIKTTTHEKLNTGAATVPVDSAGGIRNLPVLTVGNRVMFATNSGWYWSDYESMDTSTKSYQIGIDPPDEPPIIQKDNAIGNDVTAGWSEVILNTTTHREVYYKLVVTDSIKISHINLYLGRWSDLAAQTTDSSNVRIGIYTDNGGAPSTTLADENALSDWLSTTFIPRTSRAFIGFELMSVVTLSAGTYYIVLKGSPHYYTAYSNAVGARNYVEAYRLPVGYSPTNYNIGVYDYASSTWGAYTNSLGIFYIGGLMQARIYDYVYTYYNSTYGIESRPSDFTRIQYSAESPAGKMTFTAPVDTQVNKVRVYRRLLGEGQTLDTPPNNVIDKYKYVAEMSYTGNYYDSVSDLGLGGELQTFDHYRIGEADDDSPSRRTAITPTVAAFWKGRVWVSDGKTIYFSKKLEEDGATGLAGDQIVDYFPPDNQIETGMTSKIIAMKSLGDDQLVVYFSNSAVWILMGMDSALNPPDPSEYRIVEAVTDSGLITSSGLSLIKSRHAILTRSGIYIFAGTPNTEYLSEGIQSILDGLSDDYLNNSVMIHAGDEIWLGIDNDNDGYLEDFYIYDIQKSVPYWRKYNYGLNIYDVIVKESGVIGVGSNYRTLYASDADSNYILQLETGNTDNGQPIESIFETHDLRVGRWGLVYGIELMGYYPSEPPRYTVRITDHLTDYNEFGLEPYNSVDVRGHKSGLRFNSPETMRVMISQYSTQENEVLGFKLFYKHE